MLPLIWHFPDHFALVNGISASGGAIGMMVMPPIVEHLLESYGWRGTMVLLAAINLHSVLVGALVKRPPHVVYTPLNNSEDTRTNPPDRNRMTDVCSYVSDVVKACIFQMYASFAQYQAMFLIFGVGMGAWVLFLVPDSLDKGISFSAAAFLSTIGGLGHFFGRLIQGLIINCRLVTDLQLFGLMSVTSAISFLADPWLTSYIFLAISAFNVGFATGAQYTLTLSLTKEIVKDDDLVLAAIGWTNLFIGFGKMAGGPLVGKFHGGRDA